VNPFDRFVIKDAVTTEGHVSDCGHRSGSCVAAAISRTAPFPVINTLPSRRVGRSLACALHRWKIWNCQTGRYSPN